MPLWLPLWFASHVVVPSALRRANEPLASRDVSYTLAEAAKLARESRLTDWQVTAGPLWLTVEGRRIAGHRLTNQGREHE